MATKKYPNLTEDEINWFVNAVAFRTEANLNDLINSFFAMFPDRGTHEDMSRRTIRGILTSRFNDILHRTERGYTQIIADKRAAFQQILQDMKDQASFKSTFSVLNALSLLHFHEQVFTDPKAKTNHKFIAIDAADALRVRIAKEQQRAEKEKSEAQQKEKKPLSRYENLSFFNTIDDIIGRFTEEVLQDLPETSQQEIREIRESVGDDPFSTPAEDTLYILKNKGLSDIAEKVASILSDPRLNEIRKKLSSEGRRKFTKKFSKDALKQMSINKLDALLDTYMDALL